MAGETANSPEKPTPGSRTTPVLVPQGDFVGKPDLPLDRPVTTVGSGHASRLHLLSRSVSKSHALFVNSNGTTYVSDLASRSGVMVNGKRVPQAELKTGDRVQIGKFLFRYRAPKSPTAPSAGESPPAMLQRDGDPPVWIENRTLLIGRREGAQIMLSTDGDVSASHAVVFAMNGDWYVRDLGSRTGTRVNGKAIHQKKVKFGDQIEVGTTAFALASSDEATPVDMPDIAGSRLELEDSPQSSRIPLALDLTDTEPSSERTRSEDIGASVLSGPSDDFGLDFEPETEPVPVPASAPIEFDKNETLIPIETEVAELDLSAEAATHEPGDLPGDPAPPEEPSRLMVDVDLHPATDRLSSSGTQTELQRDADEALAEARGDAPAYGELPLAAAPVDAELEQIDALDEMDLAPLPDERVQAARPTAPDSRTPPVPQPHGNDEVALDPPHAEVTPRRGWRTRIPAAPTEPIPLDEIPSPHLPAAPLTRDEESNEPGSAAPSEWTLDVAPVSEAATAPLPAASEPGPLPVEQIELPVESTDAAPHGELDVEDAPSVDTEPSPPPPAGPSARWASERDSEEKAGRRAGVEILDPTDPTPESALDLDQDQAIDMIGGAAVGEMTDTGASLTDTKFGRAVDEFTGPSTGPIVEHVQDIEYEQPQSQSRAAPALDKTLAPPPQERTAAIADESLGSEDLVIPEFSTGDAQPTAKRPPPARPGALPDTQSVGEGEPLNLNDLAELEEFVAVPEDEPAEGELSLEAPDELTTTSSAPSPSPLATPSPAAPVAEQPSPPAPPVQPAAPSESSPQTGKPGPSLFGFNFDGNSFLGGMPLKLGAQPPSASPAGTSRKVDYTFDSRSANVTGLGAMAPPPPTPVTVSPQAVPPTIAATVSTVDAGDLLGESTHSGPVAPPRAEPRKTPPRPAKAPPKPVAPLARASSSRPAAAPQSLTDLVGEPPPGPAEPTPIPSLAAEMAVPPLARRVGAKPHARRQLTTAFEGLAAGTGVRNTDVFSQLAPPISSDSFGARRNDPDESTAPSDSTRIGTPSASYDSRSSGDDPRSFVKGTVAPPPPRRMRIPTLLGLMVLFAGGAWVLVHLYVPLYAQLTGTLGFTNLAQQPQSLQNEFRARQKKLLLQAVDVRTEARELVKAQGAKPGFLESPILFAEVIKDDMVSWKGTGEETLEISYLANNADDGKAQLTALLEVMARRNRALADAVDRARREAGDAKTAVDRSTLKLELLKKQITEQRALGEDRPDPVELARLEEEAAQLGKLRDSAASARTGAEEALNQLRLLDTTKPLDPSTDPQVLELRKQQQDVNGQVAALQTAARAEATAPATQPAVASSDEMLKQLQEQADSLNTKINQRLTAIQADQAITPQQRAVNRDKSVEDQSIRVQTLQDRERDANAAAAIALAKAREARDRLEKSRLATTMIDELMKQVSGAEAELKSAAEQQTSKEAALAACIAPEGDGRPSVTVQTRPDQRPIVAGAASGLIVLIFCLMILSAHRASHAAHPPVAQPLPGPALQAHADGNGQPVASPLSMTRQSTKDGTEQDEEPLTV